MRAARVYRGLCWLPVAALLWGISAAAPLPSRTVYLLDIKGPIGPATSDYVTRGIAYAQNQAAQAVILRIDTPGGLDTSMRDIIRSILASRVPVLAYVAPSGARAASAGTYILYASHIAAMAPATNLGAATPIEVGTPGTPPAPTAPQRPADRNNPNGKGAAPSEQPSGDTLKHKMINDAVAYIRSLAQLRGRNQQWAEKAVREAASLSAEDALKEHVVDFMANDLSDLLVKANGRVVTVAGAKRTVTTAGATIEHLRPDWRSRLLASITDPNVAYILMLLGIYGLFFEFANPGFVLPGVAGAICLLLALFAFQVLSVNYVGLALMALGLSFMVAEAFVPSFGALGIGGIAAFVIGSIMLMNTDVHGFSISLALIAAVALVSLAFFMGVVTLAIRARARPVVSGREQLIGSLGIAMEDIQDRGPVEVHSEIWEAETDRPVHRGQRVRVVSMNGLTLSITPEGKENNPC